MILNRTRIEFILDLKKRPEASYARTENVE